MRREPQNRVEYALEWAAEHPVLALALCWTLYSVVWCASSALITIATGVR